MFLSRNYQIRVNFPEKIITYYALKLLDYFLHCHFKCLIQGFTCGLNLALSTWKALMRFQRTDELERYSLSADQMMLVFIRSDGNGPGKNCPFE